MTCDMENVDRRVVVDADDAGQRLDAFVVFVFAQNGEELSRSEITRAIKSGAIRVNGAVAKPALKLEAGMVVDIDDGVGVAPDALVPQDDARVQVLFECADFVFISKPAGMQVHPVSMRDMQVTLAHVLLARFPETAQVGEDALRPGIVHRLDRDTSGVMVVARTAEAFVVLKDLFKSRQVTKKYVALTHGAPEESFGAIDYPIARSTRGDRWVALRTESDKYAGEERMSETLYHVDAMTTDGYGIVRLAPQTGRTHQIRVHLHALGCPIVGDALYYRRDARSDVIGRQALHAISLSFVYGGTRYACSAPVPEDMGQLMQNV